MPQEKTVKILFKNGSNVQIRSARIWGNETSLIVNCFYESDFDAFYSGFIQNQIDHYPDPASLSFHFSHENIKEFSIV